MVNVTGETLVAFPVAVASMGRCDVLALRVAETLAERR